MISRRQSDASAPNISAISIILSPWENISVWISCNWDIFFVITLSFYKIMKWKQIIKYWQIIFLFKIYAMNKKNLYTETSQTIVLLEKIPNTESMIQNLFWKKIYNLIITLWCGNFEEWLICLIESPDIERTEMVNGMKQILPWTPSWALKAGITDIEKDMLLWVIKSNRWKLIISVRSNRKKIELTLSKDLIPEHQEKRNTKKRYVKKLNEKMNTLLMSTL